MAKHILIVLLLLSFADSAIAESKPRLTLSPRVHQLPSQRDHIERGLHMIEALVNARDLKVLKEHGVKAMQRGKNLTDMPGLLSEQPNERRLGGHRHETTDPSDQKDPNVLLHPRQTRHKPPRSTVVGPGGIPNHDSLTRQDGDTGTSYGGGRRGPGPVWEERSTSRQSTDGTRTWGSSLYRDTGGNHWRVDYTDTRREDGTVISKDTVFDSHGEPIKTTVRESFYDGTATETTTTHKTGEVSSTTGPFDKIFPARNIDPDAQGGADPVAPRGWYNPITGAAQNPGIRTNNNQVNPGREAREPKPAQPVILDKRDLVINPPPDEVRGSSGSPPDIRQNNPTIVDPPRPPN